MMGTLEYNSTSGKVWKPKRRRIGQPSEQLKQELSKMDKFEIAKIKINIQLNRLNERKQND